MIKSMLLSISCVLLMLCSCQKSDSCNLSILAELKKVQEVIADVSENSISDNTQESKPPATYLKSFLMKEDQPIFYDQKQIVSSANKKIFSEAVSKGYFDQIEIFKGIVLYRVSANYGLLNDKHHYIMYAKNKIYEAVIPASYGIVHIEDLEPNWYCVERRTSLASE